MAGLGRLAGLRADRSAARLARIQSAIDGLEEKVEALRTGSPEAPVSVAEAMLRDKWDRWRSEQIRTLNHQIARIQMIAQPQRELQARDGARVRVLEELAKRTRR